MKLIKLLIVFLLMTNYLSSQIRINTDNNLIIPNDKDIRLGPGDGEWAFEYWDGGLNIYKPCPTSYCDNYKLFINDVNGYVGIGYKPSYKLDVFGNGRFNLDGSKSFILELSGSNRVFRPNSPAYSLLGTSTNFWGGTYTTAIYRTYEYSLSDKRVKTNIQNFTNSLEILDKVKPVIFDLTEKAFTGIKKDEIGIYLKKGANNYGFLAQDIKEILPQFVDHDDSTDNYYVNYDMFIPILVQAIKDQQDDLKKKNELLENLNNRIALLEDLIKGSNPIKKSGDLSLDNDLELMESTKAILYQNNPNPFTEKTTISYYLTGNTKSANISIFDLKGIQIANHSIANQGKGEIVIESSKLQPGAYVYKLMVNGKEIDSKRMIITK